VYGSFVSLFKIFALTGADRIAKGDPAPSAGAALAPGHFVAWALRAKS